VPEPVRAAIEKIEGRVFDRAHTTSAH
jgi:hypothetical protein